MKANSQVTRSLLVAGILVLVVIASSVAAEEGSQRSFSEKPANEQFTELPSTQRLPDSRQPFMKPANDKGKVIVIPPAPPGTFDATSRKVMETE